LSFLAMMNLLGQMCGRPGGPPGRALWPRRRATCQPTEFQSGIAI